MFSSLLSFKYIAIGSVMLSIVSFSAGYYTKDMFCDAAAAKVQLQLNQARVEALEANLKKIREVAKIDNQQAELDNQELEQLEKKINEIKIANPSSRCFTPDESRGLLKLWD